MRHAIALLLRSLKLFALGLGPAILMAFVCLAIQVALFKWTADALPFTLAGAVVFFFHALVLLILTAWLLRKRTAFHPLAVFGRALRGAAMLTAAATVLFFVTTSLNFPFIVIVCIWFAVTALLLPARLMGFEPARGTLLVAAVLLPWLFVSELVGAPLRNCDCWGLFKGGLFAYPLLGAYLLGLTVSSAAVSAAACTRTELA